MSEMSSKPVNHVALTQVLATVHVMAKQIDDLEKDLSQTVEQPRRTSPKETRAGDHVGPASKHTV